MTPWILLLASYLVGAIPTSYLVGRWARGIDLRAHGSGNLGTTNAFRILGWKLALPVLIVDISKGWLPTFLFPRMDGVVLGWALAFGAAAIVGHVFSPYVRFKGGKGVATSAGVFVALAPVAGFGAIAIWSLLVWRTRTVSIASIVAALAVPLLVAWSVGLGPILWLSLALVAFVIYKHRANIRRLMRGEEGRLGQRAGEKG